MNYFPNALDTLIDKFAALPGIGRKSAQRLAFHVLSLPEEEAMAFSDAIADAKRTIRCCSVCQNLTDQEICSICSSPKRDQSVICVVAEPRDVLSFERGREYDGVYHVLHGVLSPMRHIGPDDIRIQELVKRVAAGGVNEVIMANAAAGAKFSSCSGCFSTSISVLNLISVSPYWRTSSNFFMIFFSAKISGFVRGSKECKESSQIISVF